mmetsp:Transcript_93291/g.241152  ORF Transcript_93291/g.241152 Transcript_93291/m.241152 type:complete len:305 (+) Transcript_93291:203-1117(+)
MRQPLGPAPMADVPAHCMAIIAAACSHSRASLSAFEFNGQRLRPTSPTAGSKSVSVRRSVGAGPRAAAEAADFSCSMGSGSDRSAVSGVSAPAGPPSSAPPSSLAAAPTQPTLFATTPKIRRKGRMKHRILTTLGTRLGGSSARPNLAFSMPSSSSDPETCLPYTTMLLDAASLRRPDSSSSSPSKGVMSAGVRRTSRSSLAAPSISALMRRSSMMSSSRLATAFISSSFMSLTAMAPEGRSTTAPHSGPMPCSRSWILSCNWRASSTLPLFRAMVCRSRRNATRSWTRSLRLWTALRHATISF